MRRFVLVVVILLVFSIFISPSQVKEECSCSANRERIEELEQNKKDLLEEINNFYADKGEQAARDQAYIINPHNESNAEYLAREAERIRATAQPGTP